MGKRMIRLLFNIVFWMYLTILAVLILPGFLNIHVETVTSGSMEPAIRTGAAIYVRRAAFEEIREGDVITYIIDEKNTKVTHRVTAVDSGRRSFQTKGDANEFADSREVAMQNVVGKVVAVIPFLGRVAILLTDMRGKAVLVAGLLILAFLDWGMVQIKAKGE